MAKQQTRSITTLPGPENEISKPVSEMMSLSEAAVILDIHRTTAYGLYHRGEFPVPVLKVGANLRVVRVHLKQFLDTGEPVTLPFRAADDSRSIAS
jgi:predicted DNA-binding transcriptional regulator AlpA